MKKIYLVPQLHVTRILTEAVVAQSTFSVNSNTTVEEQYVKGDNTSRSDYNVWSDDWSK